MSPELIFILTLGLRMAITAAFVVSASVITERSGPVIGALIATLPISAGPSYVFLALDHDASFIAQGALSSLPINAATIFLGLTYVVLAQRYSALVSCGAAVTLWIALALTARTVHWSLAGGLLVNAIAFSICVPILQRFRHVAVGLGRSCGQRHPRAVSGGVHQHDADPASAHRRVADRRRDRQQRLGPDGIWACDRGAACSRAPLRLGDWAEPRADDRHRLESRIVVEWAAEGRALNPSLRGAKRRSNPDLLWPCIASRSLSSGAHSRDPLARNDG
jgi:hypothetical protein